MHPSEVLYSILQGHLKSNLVGRGQFKSNCLNRPFQNLSYGKTVRECRIEVLTSLLCQIEISLKRIETIFALMC